MIIKLTIVKFYVNGNHCDIQENSNVNDNAKVSNIYIYIYYVPCRNIFLKVR